MDLSAYNNTIYYLCIFYGILIKKVIYFTYSSIGEFIFAEKITFENVYKIQ